MSEFFVAFEKVIGLVMLVLYPFPLAVIPLLFRAIYSNRAAAISAVTAIVFGSVGMFLIVKNAAEEPYHPDRIPYWVGWMPLFAIGYICAWAYSMHCAKPRQIWIDYFIGGSIIAYPIPLLIVAFATS